MYFEYTLELTEHQQKKILKAHRNKTGAKIRFSYKSLHSEGNVTLLLTGQQIKKISKAIASRHGVDIKPSKTQLKKQGGFLSGLLNFGKLVLPFLGKFCQR